MIKINIKPKVLEKAKKRKTSILLTTVCIVLVILASITSAAMYLLSQQLVRKTKSVEKKIESQQTENASLIELDKKIRKLNKKLGNIKSLEEKRISYLSLLKEVASKTPHNVQITELLCNTEQGKEKMEISGITSSRRLIMQFRNELEKINSFSNVDFESSSLTTQNNFDFKLIFNLKKQ
jgi:Tfp pilus assembly protein PilN